jgi:hypothetical protein
MVGTCYGSGEVGGAKIGVILLSWNAPAVGPTETSTRRVSLRGGFRRPSAVPTEV